MRLEATEIVYKDFKFLITDMPTSRIIPSYIEELKKYNVVTVVRVCQPSYKIKQILNAGIEVVNLFYDDGKCPSKEIVAKWLELVKKRHDVNADSCVAVHCVAGLGRAPVMVAISLIELGMDYVEAVELIRGKRRGAINARQLEFLKHYKPRYVLRPRRKLCCIL